jgi:hypothetical protein
MAGQVADPLESQPAGDVVTHRQRVRIVEPDRIADRQPQRAESRADGLDRLARGLLEDRPTDRTGVLRVDVDAPVDQRPVRDPGAAEAQPPVDARVAER